MRTEPNDHPLPAVSLHLRIRVQPSHRADLLAFLKEAIPFYEAPGGIRVRLLMDKSAPDSFIEVVEYADEQTYLQDDERAASDPTMIRYLARWRELLAEPPVVEAYLETAFRP